LTRNSYDDLAGINTEITLMGGKRMKSLTEMLGVKYPIMMGALGALSNPELVAAVSEGGGFGLIATIGMDIEKLRDTIARVRELTDKPFGANLVALNPDSLAMVDVLSEEGIHVVTTSAGSPRKLTSTLHDAGIKVFHVVPSPGLAVKASDAGVDGVVAEGGESGGMQSPRSVSTLNLVPQVVETVSIPVIAAGGICDGRGYAAAFALGAKGVQLGTRLILTKECAGHHNYKKALIEAGLEDTMVLPMNIGPVRALANNFTKNLEGLPEEEKAQRVTEAWMRFPETCLAEDSDSTLLMAGQCAGAIKEIVSARDLVENIAEEGERILRTLRQ
jgi:enoyl-[acyl-carrier protein] reductase II